MNGVVIYQLPCECIKIFVSFISSLMLLLIQLILTCDINLTLSKSSFQILHVNSKPLIISFNLHIDNEPTLKTILKDRGEYCYAVI